MNKNLLLFVLVLVGTSPDGLASDSPHAPSHGIAYPAGWQEWGTIAPNRQRYDAGHSGE